jgi:hypothetical protein
MFLFKKNIFDVETRGLLYINKARSKRLNNKISKKFYYTSYNFKVKFKFFYAKKFLSKTIFNYLKPNIQNKLSYKEEKILKHYGNEIDGKFITIDNKVKLGFSTITSKSQYNLNTVDGEERIEPLPISGNNFMSEEVLLVDAKYIDKNELNDYSENFIVKQKYIENSQENINHFVKNIEINDKEVGEFYTRDILKNDEIRKTKWEKSLNKSSDLVYKQIDDFNDKVDLD